MLEQGDLTGAEALFVESAPHAVSETGARQIAELARSRYARARLLALAAVTVGLGAARLASAWSTRRISLPLPRISAGLPRTIRGDEESAATLPRRADDIDILRHVATAFRSSVPETRALARGLEHQRALLEARIRAMPLSLRPLDGDPRLIPANSMFREIFPMRGACGAGIRLIARFAAPPGRAVRPAPGVAVRQGRRPAARRGDRDRPPALPPDGPCRPDGRRDPVPAARGRADDASAASLLRARAGACGRRRSRAAASGGGVGRRKLRAMGAAGDARRDREAV